MTIEKVKPHVAVGIPQKVLSGNWHTDKNSYGYLLFILDGVPYAKSLQQCASFR
jgi:hypothetical protein